MKINTALAAIMLAATFYTSVSCSCSEDGRDARRERRSLHKASDSKEEKNDTVYPLGFLTDTLRMKEGRVADGEYFSLLLTRLGMSQADAHALSLACGDVFDPKKMRAGNAYEAYYVADSSAALHYLVYHDNRLESTVFRCFDTLAAWHVSRPVERVRRCVDVTIHNSLISDMVAAGCSYSASYKLADIYAWTVDFFALQDGDRFRMIYNELYCDGEAVGADTVFFALCTHGGSDYPAIMLENGDGRTLYWNEKGESMKKAFLKAPLNFTRISSGYSTHRLHPVTRKVQPHLAVDYAAPTGTSVWSIGDGTVISAGYNGAAGNMVKIRHNGTYTTAYLHLSKFASGVKTGARVRQGQVIGYVGSTGRSTGPHLDFRVWKNGSAINPLKMDSPPAEPLPKELLPRLDSLYRKYMAEM